MGTSVLLSGAVLSSMLFENLNHDEIGEGFLIGEIEKITTQNITDAQICLENTQFMASISGYLPCSSLQSFYTGSGQLKVPNLKEMLGEHYTKVVGWYRCRGSCLTTFLREILIHEQLSQLMTQQHFILALFSTPSGSLSGTMGTLYKFYTMYDREFVPVKFKIVNMSETSSSTYYKDSPNNHLYASRALEKSLKCIDNLEPGVKDIQDLYTALLSQLKELLPEYSQVCEKQSRCVEELMRLKSLCHSSGLTPEYVVKPSMEFKKDSNNLNNGESQDKDASLKEIPNFKDTPRIETKNGKGGDGKVIKKGLINLKPKPPINGRDANNTLKNKPQLKGSMRQSRSPSSSSRVSKESLLRNTSDDTETKARVKSAQFVDSANKQRLKKRPQNYSPSKKNKQLSSSPEF